MEPLIGVYQVTGTPHAPVDYTMRMMYNYFQIDRAGNDMQHGEKKPRTDKSVASNIGAHWVYLYRRDANFYRSSVNPKWHLFRTLEHAASERLNFFKPLRDGYDYLDTAMGLVVVPTISLTLAVVTLFLGVGSTLYDIGLLEALDEEDEVETGRYFVLTAALVVNAVVGFLNALIGLLLRPAVTLAMGKEQEAKGRFAYEEAASFP